MLKFKILVVILGSIVLLSGYQQEPIKEEQTFPVDDVYNQLIDLKNFKFKMNPRTCPNKANYYFLVVVIIKSKASNFERRDVIRNTWGRSTYFIKVVFLLGESEDVNTSKKIEEESLTYGNIVQGNFKDTYRNLTYKSVMGLKWVAHHCPNAKYILKVDDDVVVNSDDLVQFLLERQLSNNLIMCKVIQHSIVHRSNSKWIVSREEYPLDYYPTHCDGPAILFSRDVIPKLLKVCQNIPYFWIDDVHISGTAASKIGIPRRPLKDLMLSKKRMDLLTSLGPSNVGLFLVTPFHLSVDKMQQIWRAINSN